MSTNLNIKIYGALRCHKSCFFFYFKSKKLDVEFLAVEKDKTAAKELRSLYTSGKLNFPTIVLGGKKLRNPRTIDLEKRLIKANVLPSS